MLTTVVNNSSCFNIMIWTICNKYIVDNKGVEYVFDYM